MHESLENLDLDQLSMSNVNHGDAIMLNSCIHRAKSQPHLNGHVSFADTSLLNQNLNVCSLNPTIIQEADGKSIQTSQLFSSYQLSDHQDYNLDQNQILRDLFLNQIILPQQDLSKYEVKECTNLTLKSFKNC